MAFADIVGQAADEVSVGVHILIAGKAVELIQKWLEPVRRTSWGRYTRPNSARIAGVAGLGARQLQVGIS